MVMYVTGVHSIPGFWGGGGGGAVTIDNLTNMDFTGKLVTSLEVKQERETERRH